MTASPPHRRPGLTLTEVLVAMFVMALGLISLLTLFPLGAIQIGYALRDDRCAQTAAQADAFLRAWWQAKVVEAGPLPTEQAVWAMDDPNLGIQRIPTGSEATSPTGLRVYQLVQSLSNGVSTLPSATGQPVTTTTLTDDAYQSGLTPAAVVDSGFGSARYAVPPSTIPATLSYPVFVDPLGVQANAGSGDAAWVGWSSAGGASTNPLNIPRRAIGTVTGNTAILTTCSLLDDLTFDTNGTPLTAGTTITRDGRYNWSAVLQRPSNDRRTVANLTILVFDGRPPLLKLPDAEVVKAAAATVTPKFGSNPGSTSISVTLSAPTDPPVIRKGGWVMDGTVSATGTRHANFYRIVGLTETSANSFTLDIDPPIRPRSDGLSDSYTPTLYFFAGLAEVFARPPLVPNPTPGQ